MDDTNSPDLTCSKQNSGRPNNYNSLLPGYSWCICHSGFPFLPYSRHRKHRDIALYKNSRPRLPYKPPLHFSMSAPDPQGSFYLSLHYQGEIIDQPPPYLAFQAALTIRIQQSISNFPFHLPPKQYKTAVYLHNPLHVLL